MALRKLLSDIAAGWPDYRKLRRTDSSHPEFVKVIEELPFALRHLLPGASSFKVKGSTGNGNITTAPWVATFEKTVTTTATSGYYLVYLYSINLDRIYLSLAFGTTQFKTFFKSVKDRHKTLRASADILQKLLPTLPSTAILGPLALSAARGDRMHVDYEQSNIAAIEYDMLNLPSDVVLEADYRTMVGIYLDLIANPVTPSVSKLLEATVPVASTTPQPIVTTFIPRPPKSNGRGGTGNGMRVSTESKKIGDRGEAIVFDYEKGKVRLDGHNPNEVRWLAREGETPGWDITSLDAAGSKIRIEVKASVGKSVGSLLITANEWNAASRHGSTYYIYLVTDVMSARPGIEIIGDPARLVREGKLQSATASWLLGLSPAGLPSPLLVEKEPVATA